MMKYSDFNKNKYSRIYFAIVERARSRDLSTYSETHHIVPRCLGGTDDKFNLIKLTAREHFICHWLLTKMVIGPNKIKMKFALGCMRCCGPGQERYNSPITARVYENLKIELSTFQSSRTSGNNNPMFGRSAIVEQNLKWYNNGNKNIFVSAGTSPNEFSPGRIVPWNYSRTQPVHPCVSPNGEIFNSLRAAAKSENVSVNAIRERIRRSTNNLSGRKKSGWSFYSSSS